MSRLVFPRPSTQVPPIRFSAEAEREDVAGDRSGAVMVLIKSSDPLLRVIFSRLVGDVCVSRPRRLGTFSPANPSLARRANNAGRRQANVNCSRLSRIPGCLV